MTEGGQRITSRIRLWWSEGALSRPGARRRYTTMIVIVALLVSLPAIVGALPVSAKRQPVGTLLARIKASESVPYSGLASASGQLEIPDLGRTITDVANLLSTTTRLRVWHRDADHFRVDRVTDVGESDTYRDGSGTWTWNSYDGQATYSQNDPQFAFPSATDALPPNLARRLLAQAPAKELATIAPEKIAGRTAVGLIWRPSDVRTLIGQVRVWADETTGLPLAVEVRAKGGKSRAFSSSFLDVSLEKPSPARVKYDPSEDQSAMMDTDEPGPADANEPRVLLPKVLAGLKLRSQMKPFVGTYGTGASIVAVSDIGGPDGITQLREQIASTSQTITGTFGEGSLIKTPLLTGLLFATRDAGYILIGSVTEEQIKAMADDLVANPPVPNGGNG